MGQHIDPNSGEVVDDTTGQPVSADMVSQIQAAQDVAAGQQANAAAEAAVQQREALPGVPTAPEQTFGPGAAVPSTLPPGVISHEQWLEMHAAGQGAHRVATPATGEVATHGSAGAMPAMQQATNVAQASQQALIEPQVQQFEAQAARDKQLAEVEHQQLQQRAAMEDEVQRQTANRLEMHDQARMAMAAGQINPNRLFSSEGGISRFNASLALAFTGMGAMLGGHPEAAGIAVNFINSRINQDIAAQEREMDNRRDVAAQDINALQVMRQIHGDNRTAAIALQEAQLQEVGHRLNAMIQAASSPLQRATLQAATDEVGRLHQGVLTQLDQASEATSRRLVGTVAQVNRFTGRGPQQTAPGAVQQRAQPQATAPAAPQPQMAPIMSAGEAMARGMAAQQGRTPAAPQQQEHFQTDAQGPLDDTNSVVDGQTGLRTRVPARYAFALNRRTLQAPPPGSQQGDLGRSLAPRHLRPAGGPGEEAAGLARWGALHSEQQHAHLKDLNQLHAIHSAMRTILALTAHGRVASDSPDGRTIHRLIARYIGQEGRAAGTGGVMSEMEYERIKDALRESDFVQRPFRQTLTNPLEAANIARERAGSGLNIDEAHSQVNSILHEIQQTASDQGENVGIVPEDAFWTRPIQGVPGASAPEAQAHE